MSDSKRKELQEQIDKKKALIAFYKPQLETYGKSQITKTSPDAAFLKRNVQNLQREIDKLQCYLDSLESE